MHYKFSDPRSLGIGCLCYGGTHCTSRRVLPTEWGGGHASTWLPIMYTGSVAGTRSRRTGGEWVQVW